MQSTLQPFWRRHYRLMRRPGPVAPCLMLLKPDVRKRLPSLHLFNQLPRPRTSELRNVVLALAAHGRQATSVSKPSLRLLLPFLIRASGLTPAQNHFGSSALRPHTPLRDHLCAQASAASTMAHDASQLLRFQHATSPPLTRPRVLLTHIRKAGPQGM